MKNSLAIETPHDPHLGPDARGSDRTALDIVKTDSLRVGMRLTKSLHDAGTGVLLLAAGMTITPEFLALLRERQIRFLSVSSEPAPAVLTGEPATPADILGQSLKREDVQLPIRPLTAAQRPRVTLAILEERASRGLKSHVQASKSVEQFYKALKLNDEPKNDGLHKVVHEFVDMVSLDLDLLPTILSLQTSSDEYLFQHSVNVAALSMNIATQLGLRREKIMEIGLAGLLADVGMLKVPETIRFAPRRLSAEEIQEVQRHPFYTLDFLEKIPGLPREVMFVGLQSHERLDKSGYPRNRSGMYIHAFAKIVGIADTYAAMTRPRPHRPAVSPHDAIRHILEECSAGRYEAEYVRALIDGLSVYPVGSHVELDNGQFAVVVRATTGRNTRPVVRALDPRGRPRGEVIDLAAREDVRVIRVVRDLAAEFRPGR